MDFLRNLLNDYTAEATHQAQHEGDVHAPDRCLRQSVNRSADLDDLVRRTQEMSEAEIMHYLTYRREPDYAQVLC